jgi:ABC-type multidrug transport system fused ATPase/permease subunit
MERLRRMLNAQLYMIEKMWKISKKLYFTTLFEAILHGIKPTISVLFSKYFVEQLADRNLNGALKYIAYIIGLQIFTMLINLFIVWINGDAYMLIKQPMWFDLFERSSNLDLALYETPAVNDLYREARGATQNNRCNNILNSFFSLFSNTITLMTMVALLSMIQPWVFLIISLVIILQTWSVVKSKKRQYAIWREDAKRKQDELWKENRHTGIVHSLFNNFVSYVEE